MWLNIVFYSDVRAASHHISISNFVIITWTDLTAVTENASILPLLHVFIAALLFKWKRQVKKAY